MAMSKTKFLTLFLSESEDWVSARCPEFKIGSYGESVKEAKALLFDDICTKSSVIVNRKEVKKETIEDQLYSFAKTINTNGACIDDYFKSIEYTQ